MADYAISNVTRRVVYTASGVGPYAFTFEILVNTDVAVYKDDLLLTLTTDYTVTIATNGTGSITLVSLPTGATQIAIVGSRAIQRTSDFVTGGDFFANTVNDELDSLTIFAQQNAEGLARALKAPQTDPTTINMTLPRAVTRAGKYLAFDADGNPTISTDITLIYQGPKTANPSLRNDGTALQIGDMYYNIVDGSLRTWNSTTWSVAVAPADCVVSQRFLATAGQTSVTFTAGYRVGFLYVYVNGLLLDTADITATDGSTVTFASALALNDEVRMVAYKQIATIGTSDITGLSDLVTSNSIVNVTGNLINCALGNYFNVTLTSANNSPFIFSNAPANRFYSLILKINVEYPGVYYPVFPGAVKWPNNASPDLLTPSVSAPAIKHLVMLSTDNGGTVWRAAALANYRA